MIILPAAFEGLYVDTYVICNYMMYTTEVIQPPTRCKHTIAMHMYSTVATIEQGTMY